MNIPQPPPRQWYQRWWLWVVVGIVGLLITGGVITRQFQQRIDSVTETGQETVTAEIRDLYKTVTTTGTIVPEQSDQLVFPISGQITTLTVAVGDEVEQDDVVVTIGAIKLKAPFDGKILAVNTFVDDTVSAGQPVIELGYRNNFIEAIVSEAEVFDLAVGQSVAITVPTYKNGQTTYHGTIEFIDSKKTTTATGASPAASAATADTGYAITIRPSDLPPEIEQRLGLTVDIAVKVGEKRAVLTIERAAIQYDEADQPFVYIPAVTAGADPVQQTIVTGFEADDYIEVTTGLNAGQTIVLYIPESNSFSPF